MTIARFIMEIMLVALNTATSRVEWPKDLLGDISLINQPVRAMTLY